MRSARLEIEGMGHAQVPAMRFRSVMAGLVLAFTLGVTASQAQVAVTSSGSPSYSQAIAVPPGIGGMQPNLSLSYAGGGVNGPVGHGWSVQGISMITRCPATRQTDGKPKGVTFTAADKLCLDGQRLIQTDANGIVTPAATYDASGKLLSFPQVDDARGLASGYREYRTEKDSFARIRAYGSTGASDANGPLFFKVWTKAGQIYEYGASPSADTNTKAAVPVQGKTVIMLWAVARIGDVIGNYIDFKYEQRPIMPWGSGPTAGSPTPGSESNIAEIQYTGNANNAQAPTNKVIFRYVDRTLDISEAYQQGSKSVSIRLLQGIDTYINASSTLLGAASQAVKVRSVNLAYDNAGSTKRSRLATITECTGAGALVCQPPVRFTYSNGGGEVFSTNSPFGSSPLATAAFMNNTGTLGVIQIDFDGDGKTDLLRWSDTPSQNELWRSNGDGTFSKVAAFNVTDQNLFKSDDCYSSQVRDFNGDGITDLLRVMKSYSSTGTSCGTSSHRLYLGSGSGAFTSVDVLGIDFSQTYSTTSWRYNCLMPRSSGYVSGCLEPGDVLVGASRTVGRNYYVLDLNADGYLDIVTTVLPAYGWQKPVPTDQALCASITCTFVYFGSATGTFAPFTSTNVSRASVYSRPPYRTPTYNVGSLPSVIDADGDGLMDLAVQNGTFLSQGNGDFTFDPTWTQGGQACSDPVDFNGDGRMDCLLSSYGLASQALRVSDGTNLGKPVAGFNLKNAGEELSGVGVGYQIVDINGDGRTDILRWKDDPLQNKVYLSNGDGTYSASSAFNLNNAGFELAKSDYTTTFVLGDFLGNGSVQVLRLKHLPVAGAASSNQLYVKSDPIPPDQLISVVSSTGLKTTLTYDSLAALAPPASALSSDLPLYRYYSDRRAGNVASHPVVDLTPTFSVVITSEAETGVGTSKVRTEYAYRGLKAGVDGRGMLGFRQSVQQNVAANGEELTVFTDYLLDFPYAGTARRSETRKGNWSNPNAQLLSWTTNTYCDGTSSTNPDSASEAIPCAANARLKRPYLRKSVEEGLDLGGNPLPKVTTINTFDDYLNAVNVTVTTEGTFAGANRQYVTTSVNAFCAPDTAGCPNKTSGDNWILGRVTQSTVTKTVPNLLSSLAASAGNAPNATATAGNQVVKVPVSPAVLSAILQLLLDD